MKDAEKYVVKDKILKCLNDKVPLSGNQIAELINVDVKIISYFVEQFEESKLVELTEIVTINKTAPAEYLVEITNKGIFFIEIDGGFKNVNEEMSLDKTWTYAKITANVLNALAIIVLGILSLFF